MATVPNITCPKCQKSFKGKPELIGKTIRCPACKEKFVFQPSREGKESDAQTVPPAQKSAVGAGPIIGFADDPPVVEAPVEEPKGYAITDLDETPRCPNCANPLENADSIVCLYCGYNTQTRKWGRTQKVYETTTGDQLFYTLPGVISALTIFFLVVLSLWYCLVVRYWFDPTSWLAFLDHESTRIWAVIIILSFNWGLGFFVYKRLIKQPTPPEIEKK